VKPKRPIAVVGAGDFAMMFYMLAVAMTVTMLIATAFGLHQETERMKIDTRKADLFGQRRF
jgi:hypothetical protein